MDNEMLRKAMIALAVAAVGLATPTMALARGGGGGGGGGGHGGGFGGGSLGGGGFHSGGFSGSFHGFGPGPVVRGFNGHDYGHYHYGYPRPYGYWDDYAYYPYDDSYYDNGSCYVVQRRVHTAHGSRLQPREVCG